MKIEFMFKAVIWKDSPSCVIYIKYRIGIDVEWKVPTEKNYARINLVEERVEKTEFEKRN